MKMCLVGAGYWGSKIVAGLDRFGIEQPVIVDIKKNQTIADVPAGVPVMLATPLWNHHEQVVELLQRGHDVYVEKPMAENATEIHNIASHVQPGQLLMVGHIFQYHPQAEKIRSLLASGSIGDVQHITSRRLNWGIYQTKTSPTLSLATHDISIVLDLTGASEARVQSAQGWNLTNNPLQHDRVAFSGVAGKITFDIDVSWAWPQRVRQTIIIGTRGQIIWDQDVNVVYLCHNGVWENRSVPGNVVEFPYNSDLSPLEHELQHWINCVQQRQAPATGVAQALAVANVIGQVDVILGSIV
jgi:predicted dehydrogenase